MSDHTKLVEQAEAEFKSAREAYVKADAQMQLAKRRKVLSEYSDVDLRPTDVETKESTIKSIDALLDAYVKKINKLLIITTDLGLIPAGLTVSDQQFGVPSKLTLKRTDGLGFSFGSRALNNTAMKK